MGNINSVVLVGNLTRDAELKHTNSGTAIVRAALAVNRRKKVGDAWQDEANFFDVTVIGKMGESVHKYLTKGQQIAVQGELHQERWESDGQARSKVVIVANGLQLLGGKRNEQQSAPRQDSGQDEFSDDIPF